MFQQDVALKNGVFWDLTPWALVRTEVLEELSASRLLVTTGVVPSSPIIVTLMKEPQILHNM
jgi:hypothetical protein